MKKIITSLSLFLLIISLTACATIATENDVYATVVNNQGVTEQLTAKQLENIKSENAIAFEKNYWSATVTVTGAVKEITGKYILNGTYYDWTVTIEGGECDWFIGKAQYTETTITEDFLATLKIGDTIEITGDIVGASMGICDISNGTLSAKKIG